MPENTILFVIIAVVVVGLIAAIVYYVLRFMRGSIRLSLPRTAYNPGEMITGSFDLQAKKALEGNKLIVRLIGKEVTRYREDGKTRTRSREIYRDEVMVEGPKAYPAGYLETYSFEIATPDMRSPEFLNSPVGQALNTAMKLLSSRSTRLEWKLEARLDAKGVDLATAESISLNTGQTF